MKKIILTGGGTAGHVTPNIALLPRLKELGYDISYIGSYEGMEKGLIEQQHIPYYGISSGKLRRYFDPKNFSDPFKVMKGYFQAMCPDAQIKTGYRFFQRRFCQCSGSARCKHAKIPTIIHESDITPGLANRIAIPAASRVCCNFPETNPASSGRQSGIVRFPDSRRIAHGDKKRAYTYTCLTPEKPVILVVGGSSGSKIINDTVRSLLPQILKNYQVIHLCGKGNLDPTLHNTEGYVQYEYANAELADFFAVSELVISRAGANSICELLALHKPNILIPLSRNASRGDQILNANSFQKQGFSYVIEEEELTDQTLSEAIQTVWAKRADYIHAMESSDQMDAVTTITNLIEKLRKH